MKKLAVSSLVIAFILTLATLAVVLPTSAEPFPTIYDDFNDNLINASLWTMRIIGTGPSVYEKNQSLGITFPANSTDDPEDDIFGARLVSMCRLTGDFDIQVDYNLLNWPATNGVRIGLGIEDTPIDFGSDHAPVERVGFASNEFGGQPREVYLTNFGDGVRGITATSDISGKLRLVRVNTTASGYYFANGNWVLIHSGPVAAADVHFTISAWSHDWYFANQEVQIAYDNMVISQGSLVCEPMPTPTPPINATATPTSTTTPTETPAPAFNASDWAYNQSGTVTASGECGNLSDYQVRLTLHYGSGINSGSDFYLGGLCQPDFDDVRFTRADGVTLLDYWQEKGAVNPYNDSVLWVEFDQISTAGTEFYIHYGNSNASSASDGSETFIIFNDGTSMDGWERYEGGGTFNWSLVDGAIQCTATAYAGDYWSNLYYTTPIGTDYYAAECRIKAQDGLVTGSEVYHQGIGYRTSYPMAHWRDSGDNSYWRLRDGVSTWNVSATDESFDARLWHDYSFLKNGNDWKLFVDNDFKVSYSAQHVSQYTGMYAFMPTYHWVKFDDFRVRNYCDPEPVIDWGVNVTQPTPTPTATPTATATETPTPAFNASDWAYKQIGTVTASGECGNLSDYQVRFSLHYGSGTSNGGDFYLGGLCWPDFGDVRYTKADGVTLLDYWMEEVNAGVDATVWVEFDQISTSGTDFYIYYGNPNASSASDGEATWDFFDDFDGTAVDTNKWNAIGLPNGTVNNSELYIIKTALGDFTDPVAFGYATKATFDNCRMLSRGKTSYSQTAASAHILNQYNAPMCRNKVSFINNNVIKLTADTRACNGSNTLNITNANFSLNTYYTYYYVRKDADYIRAWENGEFVGEVTTNIRDANDPGAIVISFFKSEVRTQDITVDWFGVGNYCDPEPTIDWGINVTQPTPTPTATPTATASATPTATSTPQVADVWIDFVDSPGVNVTLKAKTCSEFIVRTNISGVEDLKIAQYDIIYDPGVVHVKKKADWQPDVKAGDIGGESFPVASASFVPQEAQGRIRVIHNLDGVQGVSGSGYMSSIRFKVVGSPEETSTIQIKVETLDNVALQPIPHNTTNASVLVILPWQPGDANLDGYINAGDITKTERIILGWDAATNLSDANLDEAVNAADIGVIEYKILNIWPWDHVHIEAPESAACETDFIATMYVNYVRNFGSSSCEVSYDSGILNLVTVTGGELLEVAGTSSDIRAVDVTSWSQVGGPGTVKINSSIAGGGGASGAGYLARMHFHVKGSAGQVGSIAFNGSTSWLRDALGSDIVATWEDDSISVVP